MRIVSCPPNRHDCFGGLATVFLGTATVESDFSELEWINHENSVALLDFYFSHGLAKLTRFLRRPVTFGADASFGLGKLFVPMYYCIIICVIFLFATLSTTVRRKSSRRGMHVWYELKS
jgi:hypothetical protein